MQAHCEAGFGDGLDSSGGPWGFRLAELWNKLAQGAVAGAQDFMDIMNVEHAAPWASL